MKREFIQRIWNYLNKEHEDVSLVLVNKPNPASFSMQRYNFKKRASRKNYLQQNIQSSLEQLMRLEEVILETCYICS